MIHKDGFYPANHIGPNSKQTATHIGETTGRYYREPGSGSAVKWLVYREGTMMAGWRELNFVDGGALIQPDEPLIRLQPVSSFETSSDIKESLRNIQELCKDSNLDVTVHGDGFIVVDGDTELQGTMNEDDLIRLSEIKKEYLKLTKGFA